MIFTGVLGFLPNVEAVRYFLEKVWPEVRWNISEAGFVIAGRSPVLDKLEKVTKRDGVIVRRDVPDMTTELRRPWVAVAPIQTGGGITNKGKGLEA